MSRQRVVSLVKCDFVIVRDTPMDFFLALRFGFGRPPENEECTRALLDRSEFRSVEESGCTHTHTQNLQNQVTPNAT